MARQRWRIRCGSCADDQYVMFLFLLLVIVAITELSSRSFHCWHWSYMKFVVVDVIPYFFFPLFFWRSLRIGLLIKLIGMSFVPLQPLDSERRNPRHLRSERSVPPTPLLPADDGSKTKKERKKKEIIIAFDVDRFDFVSAGNKFASIHFKSATHVLFF